MTATDELTVNSVVRRCDAPLSTEVDGETMLMSIDNGQYYGLDEIGSEIWRRLASPVGVDVICRGLGEIYDGDPAQIEQDVLALLTRLREERLIEIAA
ncbi:PqqD family peptide modification chaperone [Niveispirillum sp.]|uniref:PqqD family peptide modification chaperone n=1 Tax=Niveispirillum sp. TaxID=1917217 RepID=UPI001B41EB56|nr:PqqD family peptide modification chaperone [Niveispirillum sp.]MBP7336178.1 PqqD family protein [Niveispirillum sp.]